MPILLLLAAGAAGCGGANVSAGSDGQEQDASAESADSAGEAANAPGTRPQYPPQSDPDYISFDALSLEHLPEVPRDVEGIPESVRAYQGRLIQLRGYVYPSTRVTGITRFRLCKDNGVCCFGGNPKLWDMVVVYMAEGETIDDPGPLTAVEVQGRLRIEPTEFNGSLVAVYFLDEARLP